MKIDLSRLEQVAVDESSAEKKIAAERKENGDMYKASFRIAMKIKRALRVKHMTQIRLAELMGVDAAVVSKYLTGKANMELKTIVKIEKALGINIIDREISPKKKKEVIILSNAFEKVETFSKNTEDENVISIHSVPVDANLIKIIDNNYYISKTMSDYATLPSKGCGKKTEKGTNICFFEMV
ncbi:MAG: helix-turn-helix domain-containing protein [Muribaculaceae bacterium]|nr:helix-turn-helix domain-containing protein [Muribaculaceae bacterium]